MKLIWVLLVAAALFALVRLVAVPRLSPQPPTLGTTNGALPPCPPNSQRCAFVSATLSIPSEEAMARVRAALIATPGVTITSDEGRYIRAVARTRLMGFFDDVEVATDVAPSRLQVRSASRLGKLDFGQNATRLRELLRKTGPI